MHVARLEDSAVDAAQKAQELPGPPLVVCGQTTAGQWVARQAFADDHARLHIECCEQRGRAVALVIVGHRLRPTFLEGKLRLKFQMQHSEPFGHRMLQWTYETSTSAARTVA